MQIQQNYLDKSQIELLVKIPVDEFKSYIKKSVEKISKEIHIKGFRPGKVPYNILKQTISEMSILEEAATIAINNSIDLAIKKSITRQIIGQPNVNIIKLAPDNPLEYKIIVSVLPKVKLGNYKNIKIQLQKFKIQNNEVDKMLEYLRETKAKETISDQKIKRGDKVITDIKMFVNNVPIDNGNVKNIAIIVGYEHFIPGFGRQLIGMQKGQTKEFKLPYPKNFYQKDLAGKLVDFKVVIKEVYNRELPKLNNNFAQSYKLNNLEELKNNIKKSLEFEQQKIQQQKNDIQILNIILNKTKIDDIPESLIQHETDEMINELKQKIENQGGKLEDYLTSINRTKDQFMLDILPIVIKRVKTSLIIREIAVKENIKVGENEINEKLLDIKQHYGHNSQLEKTINTSEYKTFLHNSLINQKVIRKLREWNIK